MIRQIRNPKMARIISLNIILCLLFQIVFPTAALALTSGPGQEEFASFEPASTTDMVDLFSGDFNYNIPLMSVPGPNGGYPINLAYHSGIGMEQEASWVGLGWTLNVGAISRNLRGLPDDFNGDVVTTTQHIKKSVTVAVDIPSSTYKELIGFPDPTDANGKPPKGGVGYQFQLYYNNYRGVGLRATMDVSGGRPKEGKTSQGSANMNLQISHDSQNGMGIGLNFTAKTEFSKLKSGAGFGLGFNYSSRQGLQGFNFTGQAGYSASFKQNECRDEDIATKGSSSSSLSFATVFGVPKVNMQMTSTTIPFSLRLPAAAKLFKFQSSSILNWTGSVYTSKVSNGGVDRVPAIGYLNTNGDPYTLKDFNRQEIMYSKKIPHLGASSFTYDLYTQTGQGTGSMFRPYLNTFGVLSDPQKINRDRTTGGGQEFGLGLFKSPVPESPYPLSLHVGIDLNLGKGENTSGRWNKIGSKDDWSSEFQNLIGWSSSNASIDYEPYYFQVVGEKTGLHASDDQLGSFAGDEALRFILDKEQHDKNWLNRHFIVNNSLSETGADVPVASINGLNQTRQLSGNKRIKRSTGIETLTNDQAKSYGFSRNTKIIDTQGNTVGKSFNRPGHHISEISMVQPDGMRYVYGLPLYNTKQIENLFSTNQNIDGPNFAAVDVIDNGNGNVDVSGTNDEFMSKSELPPYAHSWVLTAVYSADYLDVTDDGPTDDDFGYWVKFNYKMVSSSYQWRVPFSKANFVDGFKGNPNDNKGSYTYGTKEICVLESVETKTHKAIFITSPREDGYETGSEYSNNTGSNRGSQRMVKLDKIKLFTKRELQKAAVQSNYTAIPTKVVNLEYSYDLCVGIPNNNGQAVDVNNLNVSPKSNPANVNHGGKLTLNKLYFTYQNSTRGMLSPYQFKYGSFSDKQNNPDYDKLQMDRWGNYKDPVADAVTSAPVYGYPYVDFPYTDQDPRYYKGPGYTSGHELVPGQWTLKEILLPTGGTIKMDYEFDDYAYIEDKQATRMFDIVGLNSSVNSCTPFDDFTKHKKRNVKVEDVSKVPTECSTNPINCGLNRVYFNLGQPFSDILSGMGIVPTATYDMNYWFNKLYLEGLNEGYIYFDISTNLKDSYYDRVKGYAKVVPGSGRLNLNSISSDIGYVEVENQDLGYPVNITMRKVSPFTLAGIQHLRANRQELVNDYIPYGASGNAMTQIVNLVAAGIGQIAELNRALIGFNNYAYTKHWGQAIELNGRSKIRLCQPNFKKIGGGARVKSVVLNDNWRNNPAILTEPTSLYGQQYEYTKTVTMGEQEVTISSGVAYEPQIGGEENPLRVPINYKNSIPLAGVYNLFMEKPIMDNYYPGAGVGYSKVVVSSIAPQQAKSENTTNNLEFSSAPITEYEYYTGKDFPVIFDKTDMNTGRPIRIPIMVPAIFSQMKTRQARSQGYSIILSDMVGKLKSVKTRIRVKDPNDPSKFIAGQAISSQKYIYNTEQPYNENAINRLSSKVQTLEIDKTVYPYDVKYITSIVGQTHDMFVDMNEDAHKMESYGLEFNLDIAINSPPAFMIMPIPTVNKSESSMRTIVFHKVINRTGILMKVETTTDESTIVTENLAFDIETGDPILTKVTNEFKDPIYNLSYPGHWYYDNMGGAYQNFNLAIDPPGSAFIPSDNNGYIKFSAVSPYSNILNGRKVSEYFSKGDVVLVKYTLNGNIFNEQFHVFNIDDVSKGMLLIDNRGALFPVQAEVGSIKVLKSGFKNMQSTDVGSLVFKSMDPGVLSSLSAGSNSNLSSMNVANGNWDNHIINASAVEYSNDWQVFCGDTMEGKEECICTITPEGYAFFNMLQSLNASDSLFGSHLVYNAMKDTYYNGFSNILLNSSQRLLAYVSLPHDLGYHGQISGSTLEIEVGIGSHIPHGISEDCLVNIDLPTGVNWGDVQYLAAIKPNPKGGACTPGTGLKTVPVVTPTPDSCVPSPCVILEIVMKDGTKLDAIMSVQSVCPDPCACWIFQECYKKYTPNYACGIPVGQPINPYWAGMKGMWRPKASYAYNSGRTQTNDIREDGVFTDFVRFPWEKPAAKSAKWVNATTITKYSPYGFELENKDALGNYSSALYGYDHSLVTAIGSNAKYNELASENFEDYPMGCTDDHFKYKNYAADVTNSTAHTGKYSIKVGPSSKAINDVLMDPNCTFIPIDDITDPTTFPHQSPTQPVYAHHVTNCDCLGTFEPMPGKKYVISAWAREVTIPTPAAGITNYSAPQLMVTVTAPTNAVYTFAPKGNVIDGWQQIFEVFDIPANATGVKVELVNTSSNRNVFFDDIRLHPNDGNMVSYVYDPVSLKTLAELDANNYATVYVYDDEGHLNKVKKETTEGFKMIKEGRINTKKINE